MRKVWSAELYFRSRSVQGVNLVSMLSSTMESSDVCKGQKKVRMLLTKVEERDTNLILYWNYWNSSYKKFPFLKFLM